jgi:hypothetical protein
VRFLLRLNTAWCDNFFEQHRKQRLRIARARELLEFSRSTVDEIAATIGYGDAGGFRRVFHKIVGLTPSDYRRRFSRGHRRAIEIVSEPATIIAENDAPDPLGRKSPSLS